MNTTFFLMLAVLLAVQVANAEVTDQQKQDFLTVFKQAIEKKDARKFDPLLYTKGMTDEMIKLSKASKDTLVEMLNPLQSGLQYVWEMPPAGGKKTFEIVAGDYRYIPNAEPAIILKIKHPPKQNGQTPATSSVPLCLQDGKLMFLGTLREPDHK